MKAVTGSYSIEHIEKAASDNQQKAQSGKSRYTLVAALVAIVFLLSGWNPSADVTAGFHIGSGFLWFWLVGGLTTLCLLFLAAKKPK